MKSFGKGTYWYMSPTIAQFSETYDAEAHEKGMNDAIFFAKNYAKLSEKGKKEVDKEFYNAGLVSYCVLPTFSHDICKGNGAFAGKYIHPYVFFVRNGNLAVHMDISEEYGKGEIPFVLPVVPPIHGAIPIDSIEGEIQRKAGIIPKKLNYLGMLNVDYATVEGVCAKDFLDEEQDDYDEQKEYWGDEPVQVSEIDALVCTDWDGDFILDDEELSEGEYKTSYIGLNEFEKYRQNYLVKLFGNLNNYYAWAKLLYFAGHLDS